MDRAGEVKGKVILNGGTITGNTAGKAERGNDIGITSYNGTGYFATEVGQYVTLGKDMIIGDGLGNGKNQFYLNGSDVSLGQATTAANDALDTYITNNGYTVINDTLTWASVDSASETIQYGVKIPTYDPLVTDVHAVVIGVDKTTGQPVSTDIFADVLVSYSDNIAKVEVPRNNTSSTTTYAIKLMSKSHVNIAPIINAEDKVLMVGDDFDPLDGVTATDFEDGNITLTSANVTYNDVDTSVEGTYSVTYTVSDSDGATTTKTIKVTVEDKEQEEVVPPTSKPDDEDSSDVLGEVTNNKDSEKVLGETVKTSDENNILLPSIMLGVSLMIVVGFVLRKKAKRNG